MNRAIIVLLIALFLQPNLFAQDLKNKNYSELFNESKLLIANQKQEEAIPILEEMYSRDKANSNAAYLLALCYVKSFKECINNKEILMSKKIIENNWNIGSLLPIYKNIDFRKDNSKLIKLDDLMYQKYRNEYWNEYELVFIKGNRVNITNL